jgi:hypothetical protein
MKHEIQASIAAVAGACALSGTGLWYWRSWDDGLQIPPLPRGDMLEFTELYRLTLLAVLFQFGTPALDVVACILGLTARNHWAAKAALAMAAVSIAMYAAYIFLALKAILN